MIGFLSDRGSDTYFSRDLIRYRRIRTNTVRVV